MIARESAQGAGSRLKRFFMKKLSRHYERRANRADELSGKTWKKLNYRQNWRAKAADRYWKAAEYAPDGEKAKELLLKCAGMLETNSIWVDDKEARKKLLNRVLGLREENGDWKGAARACGKLLEIAKDPARKIELLIRQGRAYRNLGAEYAVLEIGNMVEVYKLLEKILEPLRGETEGIVTNINIQLRLIEMYGKKEGNYSLEIQKAFNEAQQLLNKLVKQSDGKIEK
jgi:tetratricopeptide (TPR) repeat protein